jgi:hypothetical protein
MTATSIQARRGTALMNAYSVKILCAAPPAQLAAADNMRRQGRIASPLENRFLDALRIRDSDATSIGGRCV